MPFADLPLTRVDRHPSVSPGPSQGPVDPPFTRGAPRHEQSRTLPADTVAAVGYTASARGDSKPNVPNEPGKGDKPEQAAAPATPDIPAPAGKPMETADVLSAAPTPGDDSDVAKPPEAAENGDDAFPPVRTVEHEPVDAGDDMDIYEKLDEVFPEEVRERIAAAALDAAVEVAPGITEDDILVSGFDVEPTAEGMAETDEYKLSIQSAVPTEGFIEELGDDAHRNYNSDDSNLINITERGLREEKGSIVEDLLAAEQRGELTDSMRAEAVERIKELNDQIAGIKVDRASQNVPVYYATPLDGLRSDDPENNPLAYTGDIPGTAHVALYDRRSLEAAGVPISEKSPEQIRIAAFGSELMRHCLAVLRLDIQQGEQES